MASKLSILPLEIVFEILGHLHVTDIVHVRRVCKQLYQATYQRNVWVNCYKRSCLLLPEGPLSCQSTQQLENILVRAAKIHQSCTSDVSTTFSRRTFPRQLPAYDFDASVIFGRYLQLAEGGVGISWYDLESTDLSTPVLTYPCATIVTAHGFLNYSVNANGEGPDTVWVSFFTYQPMRIVILKVHFSPAKNTVAFHAEMTGVSVVGVTMGHDWLVPIREFIALEGAIQLFHIPSRAIVLLPIHEKVGHVSDLNSMNYVITPHFLFISLSLGIETRVDGYSLPDSVSPGFLFRSHCGVYPHTVFNLQIVETSANCQSYDGHISFLALVHLTCSPTKTPKIGLHLFDVNVESNGTLSFLTKSMRMLDVDFGVANGTITLASSSGAGMCLAITHSLPGPKIMAHYIQHRHHAKSTMASKVLTFPEGLQSRNMLAFDGVQGRLCFSNRSWTNIEIVDFV